MSDVDAPNDNDEHLDVFLKRVLPDITDNQLLLVVGRFAANTAALVSHAYGDGYNDGYDDCAEDKGTEE